jgi:hypothetical protein
LEVKITGAKEEPWTDSFDTEFRSPFYMERCDVETSVIGGRFKVQGSKFKVGRMGHGTLNRNVEPRQVGACATPGFHTAVESLVRLLRKSGSSAQMRLTEKLARC